MTINYHETIGWDKPITIYQAYVEPKEIWKIKHVINAITDKYMYMQRPTNTEGCTLEPENKIWVQIICETEKNFKTEMKLFDKKVKFKEDKDNIHML